MMVFENIMFQNVFELKSSSNITYNFFVHQEYGICCLDDLPHIKKG
jgi:hypothetical protein